MSMNDFDMEDLFPEDWLLGNMINFDATLSPLMNKFDSEWPDLICTPAEMPKNLMKPDADPAVVPVPAPHDNGFNGYAAPALDVAESSQVSAPVSYPEPGPVPHYAGFTQERLPVKQEPEPVQEYAGFTQEPEPIERYAVFTQDPVPAPHYADFTQEPESASHNAGFTQEPAPVPHYTVLSQEPEPAIQNCGFTQEPEPVQNYAGFTQEPAPVSYYVSFAQKAEADPYYAGITPVPVPVPDDAAGCTQESLENPNDVGITGVPTVFPLDARIILIPVSTQLDAEATQVSLFAPHATGSSQVPVLAQFAGVPALNSDAGGYSHVPAPAPQDEGFVQIPAQIPVISLPQRNSVSVIKHGRDFKAHPTEAESEQIDLPHLSFRVLPGPQPTTNEAMHTIPNITESEAAPDAMKTLEKNSTDSVALPYPNPYKYIPDDQKDEKYWRKRRANTAATRRARLAKKVKMDRIIETVSRLEKERLTLQEDISRFQAENDWMKLKLGVPKNPDLPISEDAN